MPTPPSSPAAPGDSGRRDRFRLAGVLLAAGILVAGGWLALRPGGGERGPASVFEYVRERTLAGDGEALWRVLLPRARQDYTGFVEDMRGPAFAGKAEEYRRTTGLSREDLARLPPEAVLARESLAMADLYRGARVHEVRAVGPGQALLFINMRDGSARTWMVREVDGTWKVDNLWALVTAQGQVLPRPGEAPPPSNPGAGR